MKFNKIKKLFASLSASTLAIAPVVTATSEGGDYLAVVILASIGVVLAVCVMALLVFLIIKKHRENEYLGVEKDKRVK